MAASGTNPHTPPLYPLSRKAAPLWQAQQISSVDEYRGWTSCCSSTSLRNLELLLCLHSPSVVVKQHCSSSEQIAAVPLWWKVNSHCNFEPQWSTHQEYDGITDASSSWAVSSHLAPNFKCKRHGAWATSAERVGKGKWQWWLPAIPEVLSLPPHAPQPSRGDGEGDVCLVLSWKYGFGEELACEDKKIKEHQQMPSHSEGLHPAIWLPDLQPEKFQGPNFKLRLFELV